MPPARANRPRSNPVDDDVEETPARATAWQRLILAAVLMGVGLAGGLRLNHCELFNPDSPRYVLYARALIVHHAYCMIDSPDERHYTWRPPGLPLLLAPAAALFPYDVLAAKVVVLVCLIGLAALVYRLTCPIAGVNAALAAAALCGLNPTSLLLGTEVLTEVPYSACSLWALYLLTRPDHRRRDRLALAGLLAFLPLIRTMGVALLAAAGLYAISARARWKLLPSVLAGVAGVLAWSWRNTAVGGPNYFGSVISETTHAGLPALAVKIGSTSLFYLNGLLAMLLPAVAPGRQVYATVLTADVPLCPWQAAGRMAAWGIVILALFGLWSKRRTSGGLCLLYATIYGACLTIWPWRDERFIWPLLPIVWAFALAASRDLLAATRLMAPAATRALAAAGGAALALAIGWQSYLCGLMVDSNLRLLREGDGFYARYAPNFYYADWLAAGHWIHDHSPAYTRVLTWHADVALTSQRFQKRTMFEVLTASKLHEAIAGFGARYLVVPAAQFELGINWKLLDVDLIYQFTPVYHARNVMVLEVEPNRTGTVRTLGSLPEQQLAACNQALERLSGRLDLQIRRATLLNETGRRNDAIRELRALRSRGVNDVRTISELGWMLFDAANYSEAARCFAQAASLPYAEPILPQLRQGIQESQTRLSRDSDQPRKPTASDLLRQAQRLADRLDFSAALALARRATELAPGFADAHFLVGLYSQRLGRRETAAAAFELARRGGHTAAQVKLELIRSERAVQHGGARPAEILELADRYRRDGTPGKALSLLEEHVDRLNRPIEMLPILADLYQEYCRPDLSQLLYREMLDREPTNAVAAQGLRNATARLNEPHF